MLGLENLPAELQPLAGLIFAAIVAVGSAIVFLRGRREGAPTPKVKEFYASGSLADMGPVKELVEGVGLLYQQQIRTNVVLERLALAYEQHLAEQANQEAIEEKAQALFERRLAQEREDDTKPRRPSRSP